MMVTIVYLSIMLYKASALLAQSYGSNQPAYNTPAVTGCSSQTGCSSSRCGLPANDCDCGGQQPVITNGCTGPGCGNPPTFAGCKCGISPAVDCNPQPSICPNGRQAQRDAQGAYVGCLPNAHASSCGSGASCWYNGLNYYCCPMAPEEPYQHAVGSAPGYGSQSPGYGSAPSYNAAFGVASVPESPTLNGCSTSSSCGSQPSNTYTVLPIYPQSLSTSTLCGSSSCSGYSSGCASGICGSSTPYRTKRQSYYGAAPSPGYGCSGGGCNLTPPSIPNCQGGGCGQTPSIQGCQGGGCGLGGCTNGACGISPPVVPSSGCTTGNCVSNSYGGPILAAASSGGYGGCQGGACNQLPSVPKSQSGYGSSGCQGGTCGQTPSVGGCPGGGCNLAPSISSCAGGSCTGSPSYSSPVGPAPSTSYGQSSGCQGAGCGQPPTINGCASGICGQSASSFGGQPSAPQSSISSYGQSSGCQGAGCGQPPTINGCASGSCGQSVSSYSAAQSSVSNYGQGTSACSGGTCGQQPSVSSCPGGSCGSNSFLSPTTSSCAICSETSCTPSPDCKPGYSSFCPGGILTATGCYVYSGPPPQTYLSAFQTSGYTSPSAGSYGSQATSSTGKITGHIKPEILYKQMPDCCSDNAVQRTGCVFPCDTAPAYVDVSQGAYNAAPYGTHTASAGYGSQPSPGYGGQGSGYGGSQSYAPAPAVYDGTNSNMPWTYSGIHGGSAPVVASSYGGGQGYGGNAGGQSYTSNSGGGSFPGPVPFTAQTTTLSGALSSSGATPQSTGAAQTIPTSNTLPSDLTPPATSAASVQGTSPSIDFGTTIPPPPAAAGIFAKKKKKGAIKILKSSRRLNDQVYASLGDLMLDFVE